MAQDKLVGVRRSSGGYLPTILPRAINILAEGEQDGEPVLIVGESRFHLGIDDFTQLDRKLAAVRLAQVNIRRTASYRYS